jgi:hypothetical protein
MLKCLVKSEIAAMWRGLMLSIGICATATPSLAADRYYCAVDDANIKLSIDTGFSDEAGHKLNHFRGALIGKSTQIPADFRTLMLESSQLTQNWAYDGDLRLSITALNGNGDAASSAELIIMASGKDEAAPMPGSYTLTFAAPDNAQPIKFAGRLTCNAK